MSRYKPRANLCHAAASASMATEISAATSDLQLQVWILAGHGTRFLNLSGVRAVNAVSRTAARSFPLHLHHILARAWFRALLIRAVLLFQENAESESHTSSAEAPSRDTSSDESEVVILPH